MHFTWLEARQGQVRRQGASRFGMQRRVVGKGAIVGGVAPNSAAKAGPQITVSGEQLGIAWKHTRWNVFECRGAV